MQHLRIFSQVVPNCTKGDSQNIMASHSNFIIVSRSFRQSIQMIYTLNTQVYKDSRRDFMYRYLRLYLVKLEHLRKHIIA
jgi:hypothetical protein